jgi:hypothetical protein
LSVDHTNLEKVATKAVIVGLDISETSLLGRASTVVAAGIRDNLVLPLTWTRVDLVNGDFFGTVDSCWKTVASFGSGTETESSDTTITSTNRMYQSRENQHFDFIFDYTFFCALPPSMRAAWGERVAALLTPGTGRLLTIIFPCIPSSASTDILVGPPYPVTFDDYKAVLTPHGVVVDERTCDLGLLSSSPLRVNPDTVPSRAEKELVCWWVRQ